MDPQGSPSMFLLKWFSQQGWGFCLLSQGDRLLEEGENPYNDEGTKEKEA